MHVPVRPDSWPASPADDPDAEPVRVVGGWACDEGMAWLLQLAVMSTEDITRRRRLTRMRGTLVPGSLVPISIAYAGRPIIVRSYLTDPYAPVAIESEAAANDGFRAYRSRLLRAGLLS